ncbi:MAG: hypothetical protein HYU02_01550 [Thaumarchaeota archaeon]|nr:hypothetical protein [Nitrososphaerota archaeon]
MVFASILYSLLTELEFQTFREDIGPWKLLAMASAIAGGVTTIGGTVMPRRKPSPVGV